MYCKYIWNNHDQAIAHMFLMCRWHLVESTWRIKFGVYDDIFEICLSFGVNTRDWLHEKRKASAMPLVSTVGHRGTWMLPVLCGRAPSLPWRPRELNVLTEKIGNGSRGCHVKLNSVDTDSVANYSVCLSVSVAAVEQARLFSINVFRVTLHRGWSPTLACRDIQTGPEKVSHFQLVSIIAYKRGYRFFIKFDCKRSEALKYCKLGLNIQFVIEYVTYCMWHCAWSWQRHNWDFPSPQWGRKRR